MGIEKNQPPFNGHLEYFFIFVKNFVMACSSCKKDLPIVNKFHNLCYYCNRDRLNELKKENGISLPKPKKSSVKRSKNNSYFVKNFVSKKSTDDKIKEDEEFYEKCFNESNHRCEECNAQLPTNFRDNEGKVVAKWRYSHIIPKSIAPELRHDTNNINHLCLIHHIQWENGDKENMKIYDKNAKKFPSFF